MLSALLRALPLRWIVAATLCAAPIAVARQTPQPSPAAPAATPPASSPPATTQPAATSSAAAATPAKPTATLSPTMQAEGSQALTFLLKHEVVDPNAIVPGTGQPLPPHGVWSIGKQRPAACPQLPAAPAATPAANKTAAASTTPASPQNPPPTTTSPASAAIQTPPQPSAAPPKASAQPPADPCVLIIYRVAGTPVSAEWVVLLKPDGINGTILEQNLDSVHYMLRIVPTAEAAPMVVVRQTEINSHTSARISGVVEVGVIISTTGEPSRIFVVSGPEELRLAATTIAKQWIFRPLTVGNRAIPYETVIKFTFGNGRVKTEP